MTNLPCGYSAIAVPPIEMDDEVPAREGHWRSETDCGRRNTAGLGVDTGQRASRIRIPVDADTGEWIKDVIDWCSARVGRVVSHICCGRSTAARRPSTVERPLQAAAAGVPGGLSHPRVILSR